MKKIACYPGSFDPLTNGHVDVALRASKIFDEVIILIAFNKLKEKSFFFSCEERCEIAKEVFKDYPNIKVDICSGLVVNKAIELNAKFLVRGLRAVTDYENENQIHAINQYLDDDIDMVYLMAKNEQTFVSSSSVKEIFYFSGNIDKLVPPVVLKRMIEKKDKK